MKKKFVTIGLINPKNTANCWLGYEGRQGCYQRNQVLYSVNRFNDRLLLKCLRTQKNMSCTIPLTI